MCASIPWDLIAQDNVPNKKSFLQEFFFIMNLVL